MKRNGVTLQGDLNQTKREAKKGHMLSEGKP